MRSCTIFGVDMAGAGRKKRAPSLALEATRTAVMNRRWMLWCVGQNEGPCCSQRRLRYARATRKHRESNLV